MLRLDLINGWTLLSFEESPDGKITVDPFGGGDAELIRDKGTEKSKAILKRILSGDKEFLFKLVKQQFGL